MNDIFYVNGLIFLLLRREHWHNNLWLLCIMRWRQLRFKSQTHCVESLLNIVSWQIHLHICDVSIVISHWNLILNLRGHLTHLNLTFLAIVKFAEFAAVHLAFLGALVDVMINLHLIHPLSAHFNQRMHVKFLIYCLTFLLEEVLEIQFSSCLFISYQHLLWEHLGNNVLLVECATGIIDGVDVNHLLLLEVFVAYSVVQVVLFCFVVRQSHAIQDVPQIQFLKAGLRSLEYR